MPHLIEKRRGTSEESEHGGKCLRLIAQLLPPLSAHRPRATPTAQPEQPLQSPHNLGLLGRWRRGPLNLPPRVPKEAARAQGLARVGCCLLVGSLRKFAVLLVHIIFYG